MGVNFRASNQFCAASTIHSLAARRTLFATRAVESRRQLLCARIISVTPRFQLRIIRGTRAPRITPPTFVCKNNLRHAAPRFIFQHGL
jgi:hypothetical protein